MNIKDFRRLALSLPGAEESSHMGSPDFRVDNRIFATLASVKDGYGNLMLTPEQQAAFVEELPEVFIPIKGGWGRMGSTHIKLAAASEDVLSGALRTAWQLRVDKNAKSRPASPAYRRKPPSHQKRNANAQNKKSQSRLNATTISATHDGTKSPAHPCTSTIRVRSRKTRDPR